MDIIIYTTESCYYCKLAKKFFKDAGLEYTEYDVADNIEKRHEMITRSGQIGVPVISINGEIVSGFDKAKIEKLIHGR